MPPHSDWRSQSAYDYIDGLQAPEIAWEFLRRNPDYRQEYRELSSTGRLGTDAGRAFAERWGLSFRGRPVAHRTRADRCLVPVG
ncbi:transcriptional regulator domain-containing protein [Plastorhodobacter daqingensis]|uniref:Transcriptional regulator domain-containing protein n=1 Tax=Plastorhodobacter daqingensis TaxID=1387281 RepID=A0ABW2UQE7_9RHOB